MKLKYVYKLSIAVAVAVFGVGIDTSLPALGATFYSVTDLGNLGSENQTSVAGINNIGQVVGSSTTASPPPQIELRAFRTNPNSPINSATDNLGTLGGFVSVAKGINDIGQVVGDSFPGGDFANIEGFRTAPNSPINPSQDRLGLVGTNASAVSINNSGVTVVTQTTRFTGTRSYRTSPNSPVNLQTDDIGSLGWNSGNPFFALYTAATDINDSGQIVGASRVPNGDTHAFRTAPNQPISSATDDLGTLGGSSSYATAINNLGQVVGYSQNASGQERAFRTAPNQPILSATDDLGTLGGLSSSASSINSLGQVVGNSLNASGESRAFLYDNGTMYDLNNLIPSSDFTLNYASGINDRGQIVAGFLGSNSNNRIFLYQYVLQKCAKITHFFPLFVSSVKETLLELLGT